VWKTGNTDARRWRIPPAWRALWRPRRALVCLLILVLVAGCETDNRRQSIAALTLSPHHLAQHQLNMRRFDTADESAILSATAGVMQDLGFAIDESSAGAGLVTGSKDRDAVEAGQVAGAIFLAALAQALGAKGVEAIWDQNQKIRISLVTRRSADHAAVVVQVTFQRVVWNNKGQIAHQDAIEGPDLYRQFFDKLSQAVFLEAHEI
jgi:hypothetical protein